MKILIAEDEVIASKYWGKTLEKRNYEVHTCVTGVRARSEIRRWKPDLVILDLSMPTMWREEGFLILDYIGERYPDMRAMIVTGVFEREEVVERISESKYKDLVKSIMIKPFSNMELLEEVEKVLHRRSARSSGEDCAL